MSRSFDSSPGGCTFVPRASVANLRTTVVDFDQEQLVKYSYDIDGNGYVL